MKSYQEFAKHLDHLLGGVHAVRITVPGYMPLSVEEIGFSEDGHRLVSLCHVWTAPDVSRGNGTERSTQVLQSCVRPVDVA
ncbi:MAG: hypothetical protein CV088_00250 [Nitrospira sp. LK70]|nr:hypothetical protein [Nitrospira sp. LK70]